MRVEPVDAGPFQVRGQGRGQRRVGFGVGGLARRERLDPDQLAAVAAPPGQGVNRGEADERAVLAKALDNGGSYPAAIRESGLDPGSYLYRERSRDECLPWDHIDALVDKSHLWSEYQNALA